MYTFSTSGTNGNALPALWGSDGDGTEVVDIQSNKIRLQTAASANAAARFWLKMPMNDGEVRSRIAPNQTWITSAPTFEFGDATFNANVNACKNSMGLFPGDQCFKEIAGSYTTLGSTGIGGTSASNAIWLVVRKIGTGMAVKWWDDTTAEPQTYRAVITPATTGIIATTIFYPVWSASATSGGVASRYDVDQITVDDLRPIRIYTRSHR